MKAQNLQHPIFFWGITEGHGRFHLDHLELLKKKRHNKKTTAETGQNVFQISNLNNFCHIIYICHFGMDLVRDFIPMNSWLRSKKLHTNIPWPFGHQSDEGLSSNERSSWVGWRCLDVLPPFFAVFWWIVWIDVQFGMEKQCHQFWKMMEYLWNSMWLFWSSHLKWHVSFQGVSDSKIKGTEDWQWSLWSKCHHLTSKHVHHMVTL